MSTINVFEQNCTYYNVKLYIKLYVLQKNTLNQEWMQKPCIHWILKQYSFHCNELY